MPRDIERKLRGRPAAQVWLTVVGSGEADDFDTLARAAGVTPLGEDWVDMEEKTASRYLAALLHRDLAYKSQIMPKQNADELAGRYIGMFAKPARFATNSLHVPGAARFEWSPATKYTFDAGVAVIATNGSSLYWVADED